MIKKTYIKKKKLKLLNNISSFRSLRSMLIAIEEKYNLKVFLKTILFYKLLKCLKVGVVLKYFKGK